MCPALLDDPVLSVITFSTPINYIKHLKNPYRPFQMKSLLRIQTVSVYLPNHHHNNLSSLRES